MAPNDVQTESGFQSLIISWSLPKNVDFLVDYVIVYSPLKTPDISTRVRITGGALSAVIGGLSAFTEYTVAIQACSQAGCGPFSPTITQLTFEEGKHTAFGIIMCTIIHLSSNSLQESMEFCVLKSIIYT